MALNIQHRWFLARQGCVATHDHVLISDDGGLSWRSGAEAGGIAGCGSKGVQCGDEFQVAGSLLYNPR